jgi:hypothetical protein
MCDILIVSNNNKLLPTLLLFGLSPLFDSIFLIPFQYVLTFFQKGALM